MFNLFGKQFSACWMIVMSFLSIRYQFFISLSKTTCQQKLRSLWQKLTRIKWSCPDFFSTIKIAILQASNLWLVRNDFQQSPTICTDANDIHDKKITDQNEKENRHKVPKTCLQLLIDQKSLLINLARGKTCFIGQKIEFSCRSASNLSKSVCIKPEQLWECPLFALCTDSVDFGGRVSVDCMECALLTI